MIYKYGFESVTDIPVKSFIDKMYTNWKYIERFSRSTLPFTRDSAYSQRVVESC